MLEKNELVVRDVLYGGVARRQILIGAIAISAPVFVSCTEEDGGSIDDENAGGPGGGDGAGGSGATTSGTATTAPSATTSGTGGAGAGDAGGEGAGMLDLDPSMFDEAQRCTLTATDIEGPFFVDDDEFPDDTHLFRSDIREGLPGCELQLYFRLLDARNGCEPIPDAEVYIWHCNAEGSYSGFDGQDPSTPYSGPAERTPDNEERFCRGVQISDRNGVVGFRTIYPGWYRGHPVHVHLIARLRGQTTRLIVTQLHFRAALSEQIFESEPAYAARSTSTPQDSLDPQVGVGGPTIEDMEYEPGSGLVIGRLNVIVNGPQA
ncbi:uncharacterized protein SOCEGT47_062520 [Sorangium cellulosum]|uniref:Intradiol ring-cleavage dioxygenases domain-containing protein n=1 Tax=Sorangium cellulosum TaxID=56 RepID=A0A4P2Q9E3_SORCE|nr:protocatechuate 3,4-dioxygenase [Sorangium cellulosum]AUX25703.1 uncharacterized protein SOCEGT47_062520 [Sorangium cellulosum]